MHVVRVCRSLVAEEQSTSKVIPTLVAANEIDVFNIMALAETTGMQLDAGTTIHGLAGDPIKWCKGCPHKGKCFMDPSFAGPLPVSVHLNEARRGGIEIGAPILEGGEILMAGCDMARMYPRCRAAGHVPERAAGLDVWAPHLLGFPPKSAGTPQVGLRRTARIPRGFTPNSEDGARSVTVNDQAYSGTVPQQTRNQEYHHTVGCTRIRCGGVQHAALARPLARFGQRAQHQHRLLCGRARPRAGCHQLSARAPGGRRRAEQAGPRRLRRDRAL